MDYAAVSNQAVFVGLGKKFQIWQPGAFEAAGNLGLDLGLPEEAALAGFGYPALFGHGSDPVPGSCRPTGRAT